VIIPPESTESPQASRGKVKSETLHLRAAEGKGMCWRCADLSGVLLIGVALVARKDLNRLQQGGWPDNFRT
jgi:hypothetical protein